MVGSEEACPAPLSSGSPLCASLGRTGQRRLALLELPSRNASSWHSTELVSPRVRMWVQDPPSQGQAACPVWTPGWVLACCLCIGLSTDGALPLPKPGLLHRLRTCIPVPGDAFPGPLFAGPVPLPPNLQASTCNFRISVFVYMHAG